MVRNAVSSKEFPPVLQKGSLAALPVSHTPVGSYHSTVTSPERLKPFSKALKRAGSESKV